MVARGSSFPTATAGSNGGEKSAVLHGVMDENVVQSMLKTSTAPRHAGSKPSSQQQQQPQQPSQPSHHPRPRMAADAGMSSLTASLIASTLLEEVSEAESRASSSRLSNASSGHNNYSNHRRKKNDVRMQL